MKPKKSKLVRNIIIAIAVLIVGGLIAKKAGIIGQAKSVDVTAEKPTNRTIVETVSASGKIQPETEVKISADVSGEVVQLLVKEGEKVKKGQILLRIKPDAYQSAVERNAAQLNGSKSNAANSAARLIQSSSQLQKAEASFKRSEKLHNDKVISDAEFETARSTYEVAKADVEAASQSEQAAIFNIRSAEAALKEARESLNKTTILSPVDGTVSKLNIEEGERVLGTQQMAGTEIMRIANLNGMETEVDVNENDINRVTKGDTSNITLDAFLGRTFKGIVTEVANSANTVGTSADQVTNFKVKIRILAESYADLTAQGQNPLKPGLSATVEILTNTQKGILTIPIQAVTSRVDTGSLASKMKEKTKEEKPEATEKEEKSTEKLPEIVFVIVNGKAKPVVVTTGIQDNNYIQVLTGLNSKDEVITAPYLAISKQIRSGTAVSVVKKEALYDTEK